MLANVTRIPKIYGFYVFLLEKKGDNLLLLVQICCHDCLFYADSKNIVSRYLHKLHEISSKFHDYQRSLPIYLFQGHIYLYLMQIIQWNYHVPVRSFHQ